MANNVWGGGILLYPYQMERPGNWEKYFGRLAELEVEIGSGLGEFLIRRAEKNPALNFLGIENNWERVLKSLRNLPQTTVRNVRILPADARLVFQRFLQPLSIEVIHCLFPCPWPKRRHIKHRLFTRDFLCLLNSRLVFDGHVRIVTDHHPYVEWIRSQIPTPLFRLEQRAVPPQFDTKFERQWLSLGQRKFFELQLFKTGHIDIPLLKDMALKKFSLKTFHPECFKRKDNPNEDGIIFKEYFYDSKKFTGLVHVLVVEKEMTQHVWVAIAKKTKVWMIAPLAGSGFIPTPGVQKALEYVYREAKKTVDE